MKTVFKQWAARLRGFRKPHAGASFVEAKIGRTVVLTIKGKPVYVGVIQEMYVTHGMRPSEARISLIDEAEWRRQAANR